MNWLLCIFICLTYGFSFSQDISGKWIGKITQQPGGYSQLYDLELDLQQRKNIWGDSYAFEGDSVHVRIGLSGYIDGDSIRLNESINWIREDRVPWSWTACIKKFVLVYRKDSHFEYLEGFWSGVSKDDMRDPCSPGRVILSRSLQGIDKFLEENKDSVIVAEPVLALDSGFVEADFSAHFLETTPKKITEIVVNQPELQILLMDYMKVDNDTVSVYLNRSLLSGNIRIARRPAVINFTLNPRIKLHEVLLYAENLGKIPPNTSEMIVVDGKKRHRVMIVSDKQTSATVYLIYRPKKGS
jgi:hypothetical protein